MSLQSAPLDPDGHELVTLRGPGIGALGSYTMPATTGALAALGAADMQIFSFRWGDATRFAVIEQIQIARFLTVTTIVGPTTADVGLYVARAFTASDTGGTGISLAANVGKRRTSMGSSLVTDFRVATTAALTPGTRTLDANYLSDSRAGIMSTVAGTPGSLGAYLLGGTRIGQPGTYPLVLAQNEGFIVTLPAGTATTSGTFSVELLISWSEVTSY
jgi:hypothetical protein